MADDDVQLTEYGPSIDPPGSQYYDSNSYHGIGDRDNKLIPGESVALTESERQARFGVTGHSTGQVFEYQGHTYRDDDTAPESNKRIDVYEPGGTAPAVQRVSSESKLGPTNLFADIGPGYSAESPPELDFGTTQEEAEEQKTESPYDVWKRKNPILSDAIPKSRVISDMHAKIAPSMDSDTFAALAESRNGWQAIQNIKNNVTPIKQFRSAHPEFTDISDDQIARDAYDKFIAKGKVKPEEMDFDQFKNIYNPQPGVIGAAYNFLQGAEGSSSAQIHGFNKEVYGSLNNFTGWFYDMMDRAFPGYAFDNKPNSPGAGTRLLQLGAAADDYLQKKLGSGYVKFEDYWGQMNNWLQSMAKYEGQQSQEQLKAAAKARGAAGAAGRFTGAVGGGLLTSAPIMASIASPVKGAALLGSLWMGASKYGESVEAGHENAWLDGIQEAGTAGLFRYMINSNAGRLKSGFLNFALNSGEDETQKMMRGEKTNWGDFAMHSTVDLLLGGLMGKSEEKGKYEPYHPTDTENDVHIQHNGGIPPEAAEELEQAFAARKNGKIEEAAGHVDRSLAFLSPKDRKEVAQDAIDQVKGNGKPGKRNVNYFGVNDVRDLAAEKLKLLGLPDDKVSRAIAARALRADEGDETMLVSAMRAPGGQIVTSQFGHDAAAKEIGLPRNEIETGYLTNTGRFVTSPMDLARQRGEGGFIIIPGAERIRKFFDDIGNLRLPALEDWNKWRREELNPEALGEGAERMANIVRKENVIGAQAEDLRTWLNNHIGVDVDLRGAIKHIRRRTEFNNLSNAELKQVLINYEKGKPARSANKGIQKTLNDILERVHRPAYQGMAALEKEHGLAYALKDNYIYHAIKPKDQARFEQWLQEWAKMHQGAGWNPDPKFTRMRQLPTWEEVFKAGFEPKSYNPEDLFQMRLFAHTEALKKIRELRQAKDLGLAFLRNPSPEDVLRRRDEIGLPATSEGLKQAEQSFNVGDEIKESYRKDFRAPNGELYYVEPDAAKLLDNAWDQKSLYDSTTMIAGVLPVRWWMYGMRTLKGVGANILTWSLFHPKHILNVSYSNLLANWMKSAVAGKKFNWQSAWQEALRATGKGSPEMEYFKNKRPLNTLSTEQLRNVRDMQAMGLHFGVNSERADQWQFGRNLSEWFPKLRHAANAADKIAGTGFKWLTMRPVQEFFFGEIIPNQKMAAAIRARDGILREHPEYLLEQNQEKYAAALGALGKAIDARYGEMFYDNLFWKKAAKEFWVAHLLSLGWQVGAIRVYAGGIKDLLDNTTHLRDVVRSVNDPKKRTFLTDRVAHMGMYTGLYMLTNAAISYFNGYSQGKEFEQKDLFFPVIGKNPPGAPDPWMRAAPGEFTREFATIGEHIKSQGGRLVFGFIPDPSVGTGYGIANYAANKLQPMLSSFKQAWVDQKNYFGKDIGGEPIDNRWVRLADKLEYILSNSVVPIPFKQALTAKPGQEGVSVEGFFKDPAGTLQTAEKDIMQWPTLWSMMGYPQAGAYVGRSDLQNLIYAEYGRRFGGGAKTEEQIQKSQAYEEYREALASKDENAVHSAAEKIRGLGKELGFNAQKAMNTVRRNAGKGLTADVFMFSRFDKATQEKILQHASAAEKQKYLRYLKHATE